MSNNLDKAKMIIAGWENTSYKLRADQEQAYNIASAYILLDIAQTLRDISSGIHSIDSKTT